MIVLDLGLITFAIWGYISDRLTFYVRLYNLLSALSLTSIAYQPWKTLRLLQGDG